MEREKRDKLEIEFVDQEGLEATLDALSLICFEKALHVRTNYQDKFLADTWDSVGRQLDNLRAKNKLQVKAIQGLV